MRLFWQGANFRSDGEAGHTISCTSARCNPANRLEIGFRRARFPNIEPEVQFSFATPHE